MNKYLYIYGASGMAEVVAETAVLYGYTILGFVDDTERAPEVFLNKNVVDKLPRAGEKPEYSVILAFGDCDARLSIGNRLVKDGCRFVTLIHPSATVANTAHIGKGVYIGAGAIIDPSVTIGDYSIINNHAVISHGTQIGCACHLAPACAIAGNCVVGNASWIGIGSVVKEKTTIGARVLIGAGAVVVQNLQDNCLAYGVPAKAMKKR